MMADDSSFHKLDEATLDELMEGFQLIGFDWRYLFVNKAVVHQSKYSSKEDLLGYTMMEKYPGIENTPLFKVLERSMIERVPENMENEFSFPDGSKGWFELRIRPVNEGIFILSLDITERMRANQLKQAHLNGLEEMMHIVAHKIRQPVTNIIGLSAFINKPHLTGKEVLDAVSYMNKSIHSLESFTNELTDFINKMEASQRDWT